MAGIIDEDAFEVGALFQSEADVATKLFARARKDIPSAGEIAQIAIRHGLGSKVADKPYLKDNFSALVTGIQIEAYNLYLDSERKSCGRVLGQLIEQHANSREDASVRNAVIDRFFALDRFFLSLTQGRRARAGKTFEAVVTALFNALEYPYTPQPLIAGSQPDYVLPSLDHYTNFATDCIIFTCKRTLRERWRQIVTEGMAGQAFFLATIDEQLTSNELDRMKSRNVIVVVPKTLKLSRYVSFLNVISFEAFFDHHLDPAILRWKANGAI
jgi:hypothetical protein